MFSYNFNTEDKKETNTTERLATNVTQNITEQNLPRYYRTQSLAFVPGYIQLPLGFFNIPLGSYSMSIEDNKEDTKDQRFSTDYGSDLSSPLSETVTKEDKFKQFYTLRGTASPFNIVSWDGVITTGNEYYSRNINPDATGTTIKNNLYGKLTGKYSLFSNLSFSGSYSRDRVTQYQSPSIDMTEADIKEAQNEGSTQFLDFLHKVSQESSLSSTYYPFNFFSINTGISQRNIDQTYSTQNSSVTSILQQIGTLGAGLHLFSSLDIGYDLSVKRSYSNSIYLGKGFSGKTTVSYIPFSQKNMNLTLTYTRVDTWGKDLNQLDQATSQQGTGTAIQAEISDQSNFVETGTLSINIVMPITNSPYVQSFVLTGEGQLKKVWDRLDGSKSGTQRINSYEISGLVIKGTLNF